MALHVVGVRHHSPACARLVESVIRQTKPKYVLVEGPSDMNGRLGELSLPHRLPIALFTYRQDPGGRSRGSWTPFCEYSPEWVAVRAAHDVGASPLFVDLPAWDPVFDGEGMENRYSDRHVRHSDRLGELCNRLGFEDVDALWDHLFEQPLDATILGVRLATYFRDLRGDEPAGPRDGPREDFMGRFVAWAMADSPDRDVVVVCGGYHQPAIERAWREAPAVRPEPSVPEGVRIGSYLVPFSFLRLSSFAGYASGMPSPGFYQMVWDEGHGAAEELLFRAIHHLRDRGQRVSAADAIAASVLAKGLAALRGHRVPARIDLLDGLAGALVKDALQAPLPWNRRGELLRGTDPFLVEIVRVFTGQRIGSLAVGTPRPPLVADAFEEVARVGLTLTREARRVKVSLTERAGIETSAVLHRLRLLEIPGFVLRRGPSLARGATDLSEEWTVAHLLETDVQLIEAAAFGASLEAAVSAKLEASAREAPGVAELVEALEGAALARIHELARRALAGMIAVIGTEGSLAVIGRAMARLLALRRGEVVLGSQGYGDLGAVIAACFDRSLWLYEGIHGAEAPLDQGHVDAVVAIRDALRADPGLDGARARAVCERRARDGSAPPALRGAALGLLWSAREPGGDESVVEDAVSVVRGAASHRSFGDFLGGLFALAREEVVSTPGLLRTIDATVSGFLPAEFLVALPGLRQAFQYFPPRERLAIAQHVLKVGRPDSDLVDPMSLVGATVDPQSVIRGSALEEEAARVARRYGLADSFDEELGGGEGSGGIA